MPIFLLTGAHFRAKLLTYHHQFLSVPLGLELQAAPGKVLASLCMENRMVPVSPTGTSANLPNMDVMGITYST
jgi:hypothetical protein